MADLTIVPFVTGSLTDTLTAASGGGDAIAGYNGKQWLDVNNGSGGSITVTVNSQVNCDQGADHDFTLAVPAGARRKIKLPAPATRWVDGTGRAQITYSGVTSLTVGCFQWPE
jgi:hypothetical protein